MGGYGKWWLAHIILAIGVEWVVIGWWLIHVLLTLAIPHNKEKCCLHTIIIVERNFPMFD